MRAAEKRLRTSWRRRIVSCRAAAATSGGRIFKWLQSEAPVPSREYAKGTGALMMGQIGGRGAMAFEHRYDRNNQALSDRECRALLECKVAVIGCGGLGGSVEEMTLR